MNSSEKRTNPRKYSRFHIYHQQTDIITPTGNRIRTDIKKRYRIQQK